MDEEMAVFKTFHINNLLRIAGWSSGSCSQAQEMSHPLGHRAVLASSFRASSRMVEESQVMLHALGLRQESHRYAPVKHLSTAFDAKAHPHIRNLVSEFNATTSLQR